MVRQAVLKNKDPLQLLEEMEQIDEMGIVAKYFVDPVTDSDLIAEYNVLQPSPLNEKVLKEKRKKLKETFDRVMRLMHEEEPEPWSEYKRKEVEYEKRRYKRVQYFESVRHAEQVSLDDIPLPTSTSDKPVPATIPRINLPPPVLLTNVPPPSSHKKLDDFMPSDLVENRDKEPPGVPPMLPPDLFEIEELDSDYESDEKTSDSEDDEPVLPPKDKHDKNIEEFMKEVESAQKKKEEEKAQEIIRVDPKPDVEMEESAEKANKIEAPPPAPEPMKPQEMIPLQQPMPIGIPRIPHPLMFRPPPMRASMPMGIRMPPGPPPNRPNIPGMNRLGIRMPPGPPLGPPPRHKQHHHHHDRNAPQKDPKSATITAKPQIRNLSADVTRFVPATLRHMKRDEPKKPKPKSYIPETQRQQFSTQKKQQQPKDDAYQQFMSELQDLL